MERSLVDNLHQRKLHDFDSLAPNQPLPPLPFSALTPPVPSRSQTGPAQGQNSLPSLPPGVEVIRATTDLTHDIARRIVSQSNPNLDEAAKRLVENGSAHGVDFRLAWATADTGGLGNSLRVRQACLIVPGAGRTAMVFLSEPVRTGDLGGPVNARLERAHAISTGCKKLAQEMQDRLVLVQSLPATDERWCIDALLDAGFQSVGSLMYMRRAPRTNDAKMSLGSDLSKVEWPSGVEVVSVRQWEASLSGLAAKSAHGCGDVNHALVAAMDASYIDTLDCPELCGLRSTSDILTSHKATGIHDPSLWWIVMYEGKPHGCALFSPCPDQRSVELVYLGLSPALRGKGLGLTLMRHGIGECAKLNGTWSMACAVDERNAPAIKLYESLQFRGFSRRAALVFPLRDFSQTKS